MPQILGYRLGVVTAAAVIPGLRPSRGHRGAAGHERDLVDRVRPREGQRGARAVRGRVAVPLARNRRRGPTSLSGAPAHPTAPPPLRSAVASIASGWPRPPPTHGGLPIARTIRLPPPRRRDWSRSRPDDRRPRGTSCPAVVPASPLTRLRGRPKRPVKLAVTRAAELQHEFPAGLPPVSNSIVRPVHSTDSAACAPGICHGPTTPPRAFRTLTKALELAGLSSSRTVKAAAPRPPEDSAASGTAMSSDWGGESATGRLQAAWAGAPEIKSWMAKTSATAAGRARCTRPCSPPTVPRAARPRARRSPR